MCKTEIEKDTNLDLVKMLGYDNEYYYDRKTGDILYINRFGNLKKCKIGSNYDKHNTGFINLVHNRKYVFFSYHKLVALLNAGITDLKEIKKIISDPSNISVLKKIVIVDSNYRNGKANNIFIAENMWVKFYYDHIINTNNGIDLTGLSTPLYKGNFEDINENSVALVDISDHELYVTSKGLLLNLKTGYIGHGYISSYGYRTYTLFINEREGTYNINRLMWLAFMDDNLTKDILISYKDPNTSRLVTDIKKLIAYTRTENTKNYHKHNPEHYNKYLKEATISKRNNKSVIINDITYSSITNAAEYILGETSGKTLSSIKSLISLRMTGKISQDKLIYKKYKVSIAED